MEPAEKISFKIRLKQGALDLIGQRITASRLAIDQAQQAANQEEKSSAGDKYETGRAMGHLQKDMHARQLAENMKELSTLHAIPAETLYTTAMPGAVVQAGELTFFISAGLGKQVLEGGRSIIYLSPQAPLARLLQDKRAGDYFTFNGSPTLITDLF